MSRSTQTNTTADGALMLLGELPGNVAHPDKPNEERKVNGQCPDIYTFKVGGDATYYVVEKELFFDPSERKASKKHWLDYFLSYRRQSRNDFNPNDIPNFKYYGVRCTKDLNDFYNLALDQMNLLCEDALLSLVCFNSSKNPNPVRDKALEKLIINWQQNLHPTLSESTWVELLKDDSVRQRVLNFAKVLPAALDLFLAYLTFKDNELNNLLACSTSSNDFRLGITQVDVSVRDYILFLNKQSNKNRLAFLKSKHPLNENVWSQFPRLELFKADDAKEQLSKLRAKKKNKNQSVAEESDPATPLDRCIQNEGLNFGVAEFAEMRGDKLSMRDFVGVECDHYSVNDFIYFINASVNESKINGVIARFFNSFMLNPKPLLDNFDKNEVLKKLYENSPIFTQVVLLAKVAHDIQTTPQPGFPEENLIRDKNGVYSRVVNREFVILADGLVGVLKATDRNQLFVSAREFATTADKKGMAARAYCTALSIEINSKEELLEVALFILKNKETETGVFLDAIRKFIFQWISEQFHAVSDASGIADLSKLDVFHDLLFVLLTLKKNQIKDGSESILTCYDSLKRFTQNQIAYLQNIINTGLTSSEQNINVNDLKLRLSSVWELMVHYFEQDDLERGISALYHYACFSNKEAGSPEAHWILDTFHNYYLQSNTGRNQINNQVKDIFLIALFTLYSPEQLLALLKRGAENCSVDELKIRVFLNNLPIEIDNVVNYIDETLEIAEGCKEFFVKKNDRGFTGDLNRLLIFIAKMHLQVSDINKVRRIYSELMATRNQLSGFLHPIQISLLNDWKAEAEAKSNLCAHFIITGNEETLRQTLLHNYPSNPRYPIRIESINQLDGLLIEMADQVRIDSVIRLIDEYGANINLCVGNAPFMLTIIQNVYRHTPNPDQTLIKGRRSALQALCVLLPKLRHDVKAKFADQLLHWISELQRTFEIAPDLFVLTKILFNSYSLSEETEKKIKFNIFLRRYLHLGYCDIAVKLAEDNKCLVDIDSFVNELKSCDKLDRCELLLKIIHACTCLSKNSVESGIVVPNGNLDHFNRQVIIVEAAVIHENQYANHNPLLARHTLTQNEQQQSAILSKQMQKELLEEINLLGCAILERNNSFVSLLSSICQRLMGNQHNNSQFLDGSLGLAREGARLSYAAKLFQNAYRDSSSCFSCMSDSLPSPVNQDNNSWLLDIFELGIHPIPTETYFGFFTTTEKNKDIRVALEKLKWIRNGALTARAPVTTAEFNHHKQVDSILQRLPVSNAIPHVEL